jgi:hypothetical protein
MNNASRICQILLSKRYGPVANVLWNNQSAARPPTAAEQGTKAKLQIHLNLLDE